MDEEKDVKSFVDSDSNNSMCGSMYSVTDQADNCQASSEQHRANSEARRKPKKEDRICRVCGDKALGYNFDAITCESCKAFFRRNALKSKHPTCMFKSECSIDPNTRRFCSACRLRKCFMVGMNKEMILGESERQKRIQKVIINRAKKLKEFPKPSEKAVDYPLDTDAVADQIKVEHSTTAGGSHDEVSSTFTRSGENFNAVMYRLLPLDNGLKQISPEADDQEYLISTDAAIKDLFDSAHGSDSSCNARQLSTKELQLIQWVDSAYFSTFGCTNGERPVKYSGPGALEVMINHMGQLVKLLIKFAKKMPDFLALPQAAEIALLKGTLLHCILLRSAQFFNVENNCWINDDGEMLMVSDVFPDAVTPNVQTEHIALIRQIKSLVKKDLTIIALMQCVALFSPECVCDGYRATVSNIQDKYILTVKHYLESTYSYSEAALMLPTLLCKLNEAKKYNEQHTQIVLQSNPAQVEPLLREVFNLV